MKTAIITTLALGLTACSSTSTTTTTPAPAPVVTETPSTPAPTVPPEAEYVSNEQILVQFVADQFPYTLYVTDQQIIDTGWATCQALDAGAEPRAIVRELLTAAEGDEKIALLLTIVTGGATGILCPEHANAWDQ